MSGSDSTPQKVDMALNRVMFLSPSTNHRKDEFGGSLENRMRFMKLCMDRVMKAAGNDMAVLVKMNMRDYCRNGMDIDESIEVAKTLEQCGAHALVLSGGFAVTKSIDVIYEKVVVDECRKNGYWIPSKSDWFNHGLSGQMTYISYPSFLEDKLSLALSKYDNEERER